MYSKMNTNSHCYSKLKDDAFDDYNVFAMKNIDKIQLQKLIMITLRFIMITLHFIMITLELIMITLRINTTNGIHPIFGGIRY